MPAMVDRRQQVLRSLFRLSHKVHQRAFLHPPPSHQPPRHPVRLSEATRRSVPIVTVHFRWARESVLRAEQPSSSSSSSRIAANVSDLSKNHFLCQSQGRNGWRMDNLTSPQQTICTLGVQNLDLHVLIGFPTHSTFLQLASQENVRTLR